MEVATERDGPDTNAPDAELKAGMAPVYDKLSELCDALRRLEPAQFLRAVEAARKAAQLDAELKSHLGHLTGPELEAAADASHIAVNLLRVDENLYYRWLARGQNLAAEQKGAINRIIRIVARQYEMNVQAIVSPRRQQKVAHARAISMYLARKHTDASYPEIGLAFGGRHHTTVMVAVEKIEKRIDENPDLRQEIAILQNALNDAL